MFVYKRKAQYHETDQMGIIHHSNYVRWMEEARIRCMGELGMEYREMEEMGILSPVADISVSYKKSLRFDDEAEIWMQIQKYNGMILEFTYEFRECASGDVCTKAYSRHCFLKEGKLISLKKELPDLDRRIRAYMEKEKTHIGS